MDEIVKYRNELNGIHLQGFGSTEINALMLLCSKVRDRQTETLVFTFDELRQRLGLEHQTDDYFMTTLRNMNAKLNRVNCHFETETEEVWFVLFPTFKISKEGRTLTVAVNQEFAFLLNDLSKNFTAFELSEIIRLTSKYSKHLYRLLKQYRATGWYEAGAEELRELLDCPPAYRNKDLLRECINPAVKELSSCFPALEVEPLRGSGRGRPVKGYRFTFQAATGDAAADQAGNGGADSAAGKAGKRPGKPKKNGFTNYQGRAYTDQELEELEKALLE